ncbi:dihydropteroate synthase [Subtercola boreus]|uniref:dihydropteroate synthase n=1 Tax=Subtercola boreus TaxID=120213 RepID=A0A3E0VSS5_9MICO|nr:dihydropteroate synthase [Subtercola boreus]RFA12569.1 dihydropteroate synthase [Subtercola boreus]
MGVVNVTSDSFSDGGRWLRTEAAVAHGLELAAAGADIVDIGGESTRPGAHRVAPAEEQARVLPVIRSLAEQGVAVSADTMNASTARLAVEAGAIIVNDVSGALADPDMISTMIALGVPLLVSHWRGHSDVMSSHATYDDVVSEVAHELEYRVAELIVRGVAPSNILVDPGLGFAKNSEHNWKVLGHLERLVAFGLPVVVGASRKRFVGELIEKGAPMDARDFPSAVIAALVAQHGAWAVRVHDVALTKSALVVAEAWKRGAE